MFPKSESVSQPTPQVPISQTTPQVPVSQPTPDDKFDAWRNMTPKYLEKLIEKHDQRVDATGKISHERFDRRSGVGSALEKWTWSIPASESQKSASYDCMSIKVCTS